MAEKSEDVSLSKQEEFSTEKLKRAARAGTQLAYPTMAPFSYDCFPRNGCTQRPCSFGSPKLPPYTQPTP